jgi:TusA-related sulfurtransferase
MVARSKSVVGQRVFMDLRGVACPLNWAKAKARLEQLERSDLLTVLVDDARAARDIPGAAEAEGCCVIDITTGEEGTRITIER